MAASSSIINTEPADEDAASFIMRRGMIASSDSDGLLHQREIQIEGGTTAGLAFHSNLPRMLLNNAVGHRQAQARSFTLAFTRRGFGGEEWIVDALDMLLRNARPGVRHDHTYAIAVGCRHPQPSALGHRVPRVQEQVQEDLLQAPGITADQRQMSRQI